MLSNYVVGKNLNIVFQYVVEWKYKVAENGKTEAQVPENLRKCT